MGNGEMLGKLAWRLYCNGQALHPERVGGGGVSILLVTSYCRNQLRHCGIVSTGSSVTSAFLMKFYLLSSCFR